MTLGHEPLAAPEDSSAEGARRATKRVTLAGLGSLALSALLLILITYTTNPAPGAVMLGVMAWASQVAMVVGAVLIAIAAAQRLSRS